jgi:ribose transport system substrate-binding protein
MKSRLTVVAALAVAAALAAVGCSSSSSGSSASSGSHAKKILGIVEITSTDLSTVQSAEGAAKAAKAAGWSVLTANAQGEPAMAISAMQAFVSRRVSAIMVTVFQSSSLEAGISAATNAHIPVVSMAGGLAPGVSAAVDANAGNVVTKALINAMGGGDSGSVLEFTYHPGLPCLLRGQGFSSVMSAYPNVKVTAHEINVQTVPQDSESTAAAWLQTKPKAPLGIFGCYDDPAIGAVSALKAAGLKPGQVKVFGFNAEAPALAAIKSGWMTGSMYYNSTAAGSIVFKTIEKILAAGSHWHQTELQIPHQLVTKANLAAFEKAQP